MSVQALELISRGLRLALADEREVPLEEDAFSAANLESEQSPQDPSGFTKVLESLQVAYTHESPSVEASSYSGQFWQVPFRIITWFAAQASLMQVDGSLTF